MTASCTGEVFQIHNELKTTGTFTDATTNSPIDPREVYVTVRKPDATEVTHQYNVGSEIIRASQGVYNHTFLADQAGTWFIRWYSLISGVASTEISIRVTGVIT